MSDDEEIIITACSMLLSSSIGAALTISNILKTTPAKKLRMHCIYYIFIPKFHVFHAGVVSNFYKKEIM